MSFQGKVAIVTGGGSGFGRAIALALAGKGAAVAVVDLNEAAAQQVAAEIVAAGGRALAVGADIGTRAGAEQAVGETVKAMDGLDILVNNAGIPQKVMFFADLDDAKLDQLLAVNVKSIYYCTAAAFPHMKEKGGSVVNITSVAATRPRPGLVAYAASKAAAQVLTKGLALDLAPHSIRMNSVAPVAGDTPMLAQFIGERSQAKDADYASTIPLRRLCQPQDVAAAVLYLASDDASMVTGAEILVDGGRGI